MRSLKVLPITLCLLLSAAVTNAQLIISEFRVRGPNGANDEYIEIYNPSSFPHVVSSSGGSGYGVAASNGVTRFTIPNGTVLPPGGHFLGVNSVGYSLASYPAGNGTTATGDATYTSDIPDNAGIAIFDNNLGGANYSLATRMDAVGSTSEANVIYKEGAGYPALVPFSINYCFHRKITSGIPQETDNNAADFKFEDTNGTSAGAGQSLGTPGPENLSSPIGRGGGLLVTQLDPAVPSNLPPNFVRDFTSDPPNNSTFGTSDVRFKITNTSGGPVTRLRVRITDITTFPSPSGTSDWRPRTSTAVIVTTSSGNVLVNGTTLEQPPSQPNGGGYNSSMSVGIITLATPLAAGASTNIRLLFGIQQTGFANAGFLIEALPGSGSGAAGSGAGLATPFRITGGVDGTILNTKIAQPGDLKISEFRLSGPNGVTDEFIEIYNSTNNDLMIVSTDGSAGWGVASSSNGLLFTIPNGLTIPARGHYLGNGAGYSLAGYPGANGNNASGEVSYPDNNLNNEGIAIFSVANPANFSLATRSDAVGATTEANSLYKEGAGYPPISLFNLGHSFYRKTDSGIPQDNNDNAVDFKFVDINGTNAGSGQCLGAPAPENRTSPVAAGSEVLFELADAAAAQNVSPNFVRNLTSDPANNSTFGTISVRYKVTNNTTSPLTRLRLRIDSLNTFPSFAGVMDLRPRTSSDIIITVPSGNVTAHALTLEQPPSQPNGGGFNSSMSADFITQGNPLLPGNSIYVHLLLGVQQTGTYVIATAPEVYPPTYSTPQLPLYVRNSCPVINVTNPVVSTGTDGVAFSQTFTQSGGANPVNFTTASTLPTGLTLNTNGILSGTPTQTGTFPIVVTATDANSCTGAGLTYNLIISPAPCVLTCPANITVGNAPNQCGAVVNFPAPISSGACGPIIASPASGSFFPVGVTTVTFSDGGVGTCSFTVRVNDTQAPAIVCPANITTNVVSGCSAVVNFATPSASDNCPGTTVVASPASGSSFPVGVTTVTVTATDASGNITSCTFTVTVSDNINPSIVCPANITTNAAAGLCSANVVTPNPTTNDNCSVSKLTWTLAGATTGSSPATGINNIGTRSFNTGITTVTYTVTDPSNNVSTCSFTVTVLDTQSPTVVCPANITATTPVGSCTVSITTANPSANDNCAVTKLTWTMSGATTANSPATGLNNIGTAVFNIGVTTVTYTATDAAGNTGSCTFTVTVSDGNLPVISVQPANRTVCATSTATFSVTSSNAVSYQWQQYNGVSFVNIAGATGPTLSIANVTTAMNTNTFRVLVIGLCTTITSGNATLFVNPLPTILVTPSGPTTLVFGQTLILNAAVSPSGGSFTWFKNAVAIPGISVNALSLSVNNGNPSGVYRTEYTDLNGCKVTSADITVTVGSSDKLWIYPVPNDGNFTVRYFNQTGETATIVIYDDKGSRVYQKSATTGSPYSSTAVDISRLTQGKYLVKVLNGSNKEVASKWILVTH